eukprot:g42065.t1
MTNGKYTGQSPYEVTLKRTFPTGFLHPIGCLAFVRYTLRKKENPDPDRGKIVEARNVKFNDEIRGYDADVGALPWAFDSSPVVQPTVVNEQKGKIGQQISRIQRNFPKNDKDAETTSPFPTLLCGFNFLRPQIRDPCLKTRQLHLLGPLAPRDINSNISDTNVINTPRLAVGADDTVGERKGDDLQAKRLDVNISAARKREIDGLYEMNCVQ